MKSMHIGALLCAALLAGCATQGNPPIEEPVVQAVGAGAQVSGEEALALARAQRTQVGGSGQAATAQPAQATVKRR